MGEPLPPFVVIAAKTDPSRSMLEAGPVAIVNGKRLGTTGTANAKGSVDGEGALLFIDYSLIPMFEAHGMCERSNAMRPVASAADAVGSTSSLILWPHIIDPAHQ